MRHEDTWDIEAATGYDTPGSGMFAPEVHRRIPSHVSAYRLPTV